MYKAILTAAALAVSAPLAPALAHDDDDRDSRYSAHSRYHDELGEAHERAHGEGFESRREHRAFHRALRYLHREYHEDRPSYSYYRRYW